MTSDRTRFVTGPRARAPLDVCVDGALATARRETLVLAVAHQTKHIASALLAELRLRSALAYAREFAASSSLEASQHDRRIALALAAAERWLPERDCAQLDTRNLAELLPAAFNLTGRLAPVIADDTMLIDFDLEDLPLVGLGLRATTIARIRAQRAQLDGADATDARIHRSSFAAASLRGARLVNTILADCDLWQADLEGAFLVGTRIARCNLAGAVLKDAHLPMARFVGCDLVAADLQAPLMANVDSTYFVDCDLRGTDWSGRDLSRTSFYKCKLHGAHGIVGGLEHATIVRPDLSPRGDGTEIGTKHDLLSRWA